MYMRKVRGAKKIEKVQKNLPSTRMSDGYHFTYQTTKIVSKASVPITFDVCESEFSALTIPQLIKRNDIRKKNGLKAALSNCSAKNYKGDLNAKRLICHPTRTVAEEIIYQGTSIPFSILSEIKDFQVPVKAKNTEFKENFNDCTRCILLQTQLNLSRENWRHNRINSVTNQTISELKKLFETEKNRVICVPTLTTDIVKRKKNFLCKISSTAKYILSGYEYSSCSRCLYLQTMLKIVQRHWSQKKCFDILKKSQAELQNV